MSVSNEQVLKSIRHYQESLDKYSLNKNDYKLLDVIKKLKRLPISTSHLENTGIGRTVNGLRKLGGDVGDAAKSLVGRWKEMVLEEEEKAKEKIQEEPVNTSCSTDDIDNDESTDELPQDIEESKSSHISSDMEKKNSDKHKSEYDKHTSNSKKSSDKKERHRDGDSSSKKRKPDYKSESEERHSKKRSVSSSSESEEDSYEERHRKSTSRRRHRSTSSEEEDEKHRSKKSKHHSKDSSSDERENGTKSSNSSKSHRSKSKSSEKTDNRKHNNDSHNGDEKSKSKTDKSKRESDCEEIKSTGKHKRDSKSELEETKFKNRHESKSRHEKDTSKESKSHSSRSEKSEKKDKKESKSSDSKEFHSHKKDDVKKYDDKSKKSKGERESDKKEKSLSKSEESSKSSNHTAKQKSSSERKKEPEKVKLVNNEKMTNGIDSGSGASFADALGMCEPIRSSKTPIIKKKKSSSATITSEKPRASSSNYTKQEKYDDYDDEDEDDEDNVPSLLKQEPPEPLNLNISSLLPEITPNYRPLGIPLDLQPRRVLTPDEALSQAISNKNMRTKVYSGNKSYGKLESLFDLCVRVLQDNIDALEYTGGVPYLILKPVLEKATPDQLFNMEHHNPYLIEDTDELWHLHCQKEFRTKKREELESWREMYMRCLDEREARLNAITANIKQSQDKSIPVRTTKLAYVDSVVKPPRNIARKQAKNGILIQKPAQTPASRLSALATAGEAGKVAVPNPGSRAVDRSSSSSSNSSALKPKKAPLMAKSLSLFKNRFRK